MSAKTYWEMEQENVAIRGLLKEAAKWGNHDTACQNSPCNCWLAYVERVLNPPIDLSLPKTLSVFDGIECAKCHHTINSHVGQKGLCTGESCPCFKFVPPTQEVVANP